MTHWDMSHVYASLDYERRKPVEKVPLSEKILEQLRKWGVI